MRGVEPKGANVERYLPLVLLTTAGVVVLPAAIAAAIVPPVGTVRTVASVALAAAISIGLTNCFAAAWSRRGTSELVFSELLLWGWLRRWYAERRLHEVRHAYETAARSNAVVRVELLEGLARLLAIRNPYTHGHCQRVARHAERIARAMRLAPAEVAKVRTAAMVHDVGKVYTPPAILNKPTRLTDEEFATIKLHAAEGAEMLGSVRDPELADIVRHHHERIDGSGYPDGLAGGKIPLGARIIAVADTFDAITSHRPYRRARNHKEALRLLAAERGAQLDADVVDAFTEGYCPRRSVASIALATVAFERVSAALQLGSGALGAGGASLAQLWPALGAAGLLAAAPASGHSSHAVVSHTARKPLPREAAGVRRAGSFERAGGGGSTRESFRRHSPSPVSGRSVPRSLLRHPSGASAATLAERAGSGASSSVTVTVHAKPPSYPRHEETTAPPNPPTPPVTTPTKPPVTTPPVSTPPVTTPAVTTPSVTTPPIVTPQVKVPPVTVPRVTIPPVTVPSIHLP